MTKFIEKIEKQIKTLQGKIDALSGNYLTNTWKRQREQRERDRKKEIYRTQLQVLEYLKQKAETDTLSLFEQNLMVAAFTRICVVSPAQSNTTRTVPTVDLSIRNRRMPV